MKKIPFLKVVNIDQISFDIEREIENNLKKGCTIKHTQITNL